VKARRAAQLIFSLAALVGAGSCLDVSGTGIADADIRIVNASGQELGIYLDGQLAIDGSQQLNISLITAPSGTHTLNVRTAAGVDTPLNLDLTPGGFTNTYAYTNSSGVVNLVLLDTTEVPAPNMSKVRAINLSRTAGAIDIYASQPDSTAGTLLSPTFDYLASTPYSQRNAGSWDVYITTAGTTTKLLTTGSFTLLPTERRTIVLIDSASVPIFRALPN
jgi:hypothetical protein